MEIVINENSDNTSIYFDLSLFSNILETDYEFFIYLYILTNGNVDKICDFLSLNPLKFMNDLSFNKRFNNDLILLNKLFRHKVLSKMLLLSEERNSEKLLIYIHQYLDNEEKLLTNNKPEEELKPLRIELIDGNKMIDDFIL